MNSEKSQSSQSPECRVRVFVKSVESIPIAKLCLLKYVPITIYIIQLRSGICHDTSGKLKKHSTSLSYNRGFLEHTILVIFYCHYCQLCIPKNLLITSSCESYDVSKHGNRCQ